MCLNFRIFLGLSNEREKADGSNTIAARETGGTSETGEGPWSEVRGFRNLELQTSNRAFLAYLALHAPRSAALAGFFSILLDEGRERRIDDRIADQPF